MGKVRKGKLWDTFRAKKLLRDRRLGCGRADRIAVRRYEANF